jgi:hypothetical protein
MKKNVILHVLTILVVLGCSQFKIDEAATVTEESRIMKMGISNSYMISVTDSHYYNFYDLNDNLKKVKQLSSLNGNKIWSFRTLGDYLIAIEYSEDKEWFLVCYNLSNLEKQTVLDVVKNEKDFKLNYFFIASGEYILLGNDGKDLGKVSIDEVSGIQIEYYNPAESNLSSLTSYVMIDKQLCCYDSNSGDFYKVFFNSDKTYSNSEDFFKWPGGKHLYGFLGREQVAFSNGKIFVFEDLTCADFDLRSGVFYVIDPSANYKIVYERTLYEGYSGLVTVGDSVFIYGYKSPLLEYRIEGSEIQYEGLTFVRDAKPIVTVDKKNEVLYYSDGNKIRRLVK